MSRLFPLLLSAALAAGAAVGVYAQGMHGRSGMDMKDMHGQMGVGMKSMDADGDGRISKDEFMKFHEAMFDKMKGKDGTVAMKDMPMDCPMMKGGADGGTAKGSGGMMDHRGMMGGTSKGQQ